MWKTIVAAAALCVHSLPADAAIIRTTMTGQCSVWHYFDDEPITLISSRDDPTCGPPIYPNTGHWVEPWATPSSMGVAFRGYFDTSGSEYAMSGYVEMTADMFMTILVNGGTGNGTLRGYFSFGGGGGDGGNLFAAEVHSTFATIPPYRDDWDTPFSIPFTFGEPIDIFMNSRFLVGNSDPAFLFGYAMSWGFGINGAWDSNGDQVMNAKFTDVTVPEPSHGLLTAVALFMAASRIRSRAGRSRR